MAQFHMCMRKDWSEEWNFMGFRDTIHAYGRASGHASGLYTTGRALARRLGVPEDTPLWPAVLAACYWGCKAPQVHLI